MFFLPAISGPRQSQRSKVIKYTLSFLCVINSFHRSSIPIQRDGEKYLKFEEKEDGTDSNGLICQDKRCSNGGMKE